MAQQTSMAEQNLAEVMDSDGNAFSNSNMLWQMFSVSLRISAVFLEYSQRDSPDGFWRIAPGQESCRHCRKRPSGPSDTELGLRRQLLNSTIQTIQKLQEFLKTNGLSQHYL